MTRVFVDTSAILALLVASDRAHGIAAEAFLKLSSHQAVLITTSYVLVETYALLGRRLGLEAVKRFREDFSPLLDVVWVHKELHEKALDVMLQRKAAALSLVDITSFLVAHEQKIDSVFAFDEHFEKEGFVLIT